MTSTAFANKGKSNASKRKMQEANDADGNDNGITNNY